MKSWKKYAGFYVFVCAAAICGALLLSHAGTAAGTVAAARELPPVVVIDAGHGGEDGGVRPAHLGAVQDLRHLIVDVGPHPLHIGRGLLRNEREFLPADADDHTICHKQLPPRR